MVQSVKKYLLLAALLGVAFVLGMYCNPKSETIVTQEKIVYVEKTDTVRKEQGKVYEKETISKDGTKTIERTTDYRTETAEQKNINLNRDYSFRSVTESLPSHQFTLLYDPNPDLVAMESYSLMYQRRVFSSFYAGAWTQLDFERYGLAASIGW